MPDRASIFAVAPLLFVVLGPDGVARNAMTPTWDLPTDGEPGRWMRRPGRLRRWWKLQPAADGYHLIEADSLAPHIKDNVTLWLAEGRGTAQSVFPGLQTYEEARLLREVELSEQVLRYWAADCAEHVLPAYEERRPNDDRPRRAVEAARHLALGMIGYPEAKAIGQESSRASLERWDHNHTDPEMLASRVAAAAAFAAIYNPAGAAAQAAWWREAQGAAPGTAEQMWQSQKLLGYVLRGTDVQKGSRSERA
jgi:hypothetical protein